jgi:hypothetical protein
LDAGRKHHGPHAQGQRHCRDEQAHVSHRYLPSSADHRILTAIGPADNR